MVIASRRKVRVSAQSSLLLSALIVIQVIPNPSLAPRIRQPTPLKERLGLITEAGPVALIVICVIVSIYAAITPPLGFNLFVLRKVVPDSNFNQFVAGHAPLNIEHHM